MEIHPASHWQKDQIETFLLESRIPVRLAFCDAYGHPRICSLWFKYEDGVLWSASHESAYLIKQLVNDNRVSFEVSTNDYPYKGVRGKAGVELSREGAGDVLGALIEKYLGGSNRKLADWLMSRVDGEYAIKITPSSVNAWDFSGRMEANGR